MEAAGDRAFMERFVVVNMRAKFVNPDSPELGQPHTHLRDSTVEDRLLSPGCIAAHVKYLFESYCDFLLRENKVIKLPTDSKAFIERIVIDADPIMPHALAFIEAKYQLQPGAFIKKTDVEQHFGEFLDSNVSTMDLNKKRRKRNSVLKAALVHNGFRFLQDTHVQGVKVKDSYMGLAIKSPSN